jgi:hypothetical protein
MCGCGNSPGVTGATQTVRAALRDHDGHGGDTLGISVNIGPWEKDVQQADGKHLLALWQAAVTMPEDYGYIVTGVDGKNVVRVAAKGGAVVKLSGVVATEQGASGWVYSLPNQDAWASYRNALGMSAEYTVWESGGGRRVVARGTGASGFPLEAVSTISDAVEEDSEEGRRLGALVMTAEQLRKEGPVMQMPADAGPRQLAVKVVGRMDPAKAGVLKPWFDVLEGKEGDVIGNGAGDEVGMLLTDMVVDEAGGTVTGKGLDMRKMPFAEFTFTGTLGADGGAVTLKMTTSLSGETVVFERVNAKGALEGNGVTLRALDEARRTALDREAALGKKLGSAAAVALQGRVVAPAEVAALQAGLVTEPLTGILTSHGKKAGGFEGLFSGNTMTKRIYTWMKGPLSLRMVEPVQGSAIYIAGGGVSDESVVVINGVHRVMLGEIASGASAEVTVPKDLEIMDVRIEARGYMHARGVMLVK